jgi:tetratricopeptide (TPR) repeat protein
MKRRMAKLAWSDEMLVAKIRELHKSKGSLTTIKRYREGTATNSPTVQTVGIIAAALGFSDEERNWVLEGDSATSVGYPSTKDQTDQWQQLLAYLQQQTNLPYEVRQRQQAAEAAVAEEDYARAKTELTEVANALYRPAAYHAEEYARALAALGALAFTETDYAEARVQYGKAIEIRPIGGGRLARYQYSYRVACNACVAEAQSEAEARAILKEMTDNGVTPDVVSYSTLLNFVKSEAEARAILKEMTDNGVTPNVVS